MKVINVGPLHENKRSTHCEVNGAQQSALTIEERGSYDGTGPRGKSEDIVNRVTTAPQGTSDGGLVETRHGDNFLLDLDRDVLAVAHRGPKTKGTRGKRFI